MLDWRLPPRRGLWTLLSESKFFSIAILSIIYVYCEDYAGYFTVILSFLAFYFCYAYFIYLISCMFHVSACGLATWHPHFSFCPILSKLWKSIMFSFDVLLRQFMHHWKYLVELYAMNSFSLAFEIIIFLAFWIFLDHTSLVKNFWTSKIMDYSTT